MRQDHASRRPSLFQRLFAERQVYLRSGQDSRYVVLSRPFQIGVTLAILVVIGGLAFASYSAVANHLEAMERSRELARLEGVNKSLRAAAETPPANEEMRAAAEQVPKLEAALAEAQAARARAEELAEASAAEADELRRELQLAEERVQRVTESLAEAQDERDGLAEQLAAQQGVAEGEGDGAGEEATALRAELEDAAQRVETLSTERNRLQERVEQLEAQAEAATAGTAAEVDTQLAEALERSAQLQRELQQANQRIQALQTELEAARTEVARLQTQTVEPAAGPGAGDAVAPQLLADIADDGPEAGPTPVYVAGEETIAALTAELARAKNALEALRDDAEGGDGDLSSLEDQLTAAGEQLDQLERVLERLKAREAAINLAMSNLAPPPPPPAPR